MDKDARPEDWYAKDYDLPAAGALAAFLILTVLLLADDTRNSYAWYVNAMVAIAMWSGVTHYLIDSLYRWRRYKDGQSHPIDRENGE
jgi:hypothetical protein